MVKRASIIVYYKHTNILNKINNISEVSYSSAKQKYSVIYLNAKDVKRVKESLLKLKGVKSVIDSLVELEEL